MTAERPTGGRDPLSASWDPWARELLEVLRADPWQWHGRAILSEQRGDHGRWHLTEGERAAQRSLYWNLGHAASSGARIRPQVSLQVAWTAPVVTGRGVRRRMLSARVMPREAGRRYYLERQP